jgi:hypothetical protein
MIYSELRSDKALLKDINEEKSVFLLGCPACANTSIYIQKADQDSDMLRLTPTGYKAVSMVGELKRLKDLLTNKSIDVDSWVGKYPTITLCLLDEHSRNIISKKCQDYKTIITLSCDAGKKSVEGILSGKRVIAGMKARGLAITALRSKMRFAKFYIDKSKVDIKRFTFDS